VPALAGGDTSGHQMGDTQGFRHTAVHGEALDQVLCIPQLQTRPLHVHAGSCFHGPGALDDAPFAPAARHMVEQGVLDLCQTRRPPGDDEYWQTGFTVYRLDIHYVETRESDALQQDGMQLGGEARSCHQPHNDIGRVAAVAADFAAQYALEPCAGENGAYDQYISPVPPVKRSIVKAHHMGERHKGWR